jgi:hypothetical protein
MNAETALLTLLLLVALTSGVASILVARLLTKFGFATFLAAILASAFIPALLAWQMTRGSIDSVARAPWWFLAVTYAGGLLACWAYYRRRT